MRPKIRRVPEDEIKERVARAAKGVVYAEAPIRYSFRESGTSFVRLGRYLRKVIPAVYRELNAPPADPSAATG